MTPPRINAALKDLQPLVGEWTIEIVLPGDPPEAFFGTVTCEWVDGGAFLLMRSTVDWAGPSGSVAIIGRDETEDGYLLLYHDDRDVSRVYKMAFGDGTWHQWRTAPDFSQRFVATIGFTGDVMTGRWETSSDGVSWTHDFDVIYRRVD